MSTSSLAKSPVITRDVLERMLFIVCAGIGFYSLVSLDVIAGGTATTIFDQLATDTDAAIFGPLGQAIIGLCAAAGGIFALIKGNWLFAALGIAVAGLMVGARVVAGSSGFGAMITDGNAFLPIIGM